MSDYKDTLNLPKTSFSMKANLAQREPEMLKYWQGIDLYRTLRQLGKDHPSFTLHDGPPYANGAIHLGTTMNKVLKDIVTKSKTLSGFNAPYVPGWDCHGLPIELKVEKKVGKPGAKLSAKEFRQACRDYAKKQVAIQMEDFKRLGVVGEWDHPYLTMDASYEAQAVRVLAEIIKHGHLHRGEKPVHWCVDCASALAEAEVEYKDKQSPAIDVGFSALKAAEVYGAFSTNQDEHNVVIPIWTTTPWTLPANQAVSVNPNVDYVLVRCKLGSRLLCLVVAKALLDGVMQRYGIDDYQVLAESKGKVLEHIQLQHPLFDRHVPVILGDHVTTDAGTGNVHTAPAHGLDDYVVGKRYGLPINNPVNSCSCFRDDVADFAGLHVFKANDPIIATLEKSGHLLSHETMQHSYPHCWRHKTPLIFRATPQWFISMDQNHLREQTLQEIKHVDWIPSWGEKRISKMVESRPDWCLSRQRTWGIPIAIFTDKETGEMHPKTYELMHQVADLIEKGGIDAWFDLKPETLLGGYADQYDKVMDITDVWFESGVSHACVLEVRPDLHVPADLYLEGSDQHRGWFQSAVLSSVAIRDKAPFKQVLTHGYVVDGNGHKMSKSIGNVVSPADVVKKSGADILRLWAAACDHTGDVRYSDEILKRTSDAYRRIRNTARFLLSNLFDFDPHKDKVSGDDLLALDAWAVQFTEQLQAKIVDAYDRYQFQNVYQLIHNFCAVEMGSFYLDIIKDRLYTSKANGVPRRSAQTALYYILQALVRWLAPVLSFTAEEIWQHAPGEKVDSVFFTTWFTDFPSVNVDNSIDWAWLMQVRDEVNKVLEQCRNDNKIGSALDADVELYADDSIYDKLTPLKDELRFVLITSGATAANDSPSDAVATAIAGLSVKVVVTDDTKCVRCWQRRDDVGQDEQHAELCGRCVANVFGDGEVRHYA